MIEIIKCTKISKNQQKKRKKNDEKIQKKKNIFFEKEKNREIFGTLVQI